MKKHNLSAAVRTSVRPKQRFHEELAPKPIDKDRLIEMVVARGDLSKGEKEKFTRVLEELL